MKSLASLLEKKLIIRTIGFDDAPFIKTMPYVNISGIICANTRFEGMLWDKVIKDGLDATDTLITLVRNSKFYEQIHVILLDGLAFAGFNLIDLPRLTHELQRPCITVMRKMPDFAAIDRALQYFTDYSVRQDLIKKAGPIYQKQGFYFQVLEEDPEIIAAVLMRLTDTGQVPEALRLAHLIGAAVMTGQSSKRA